ncbi:reticulon-3-B-like isoform X1 [Platichthys flesus]|uniref:reticulon-3-B-like isoform X1 n=1 Tax=Platichthys flesus TaxID=8260 RepID=UPI002DB6B01A|nr:reticulon-3-B-like isoform X1 [Platichthys flesus]
MADSTSSCSSSANSSSSSVRRLTLSAFQLVHWKQPKKSAAAFGLSLLVLVSVATLSVISVVSYLLLAGLCVTITFRVYKSVIQAVQKSDEGHPFRGLLDRDISVSSESVRQLADQGLIHLNWFSSETRRLLLVEDLVDSLKLAAVMWLMTYVGSVFNGVTILILGETASVLVLFWFCSVLVLFCSVLVLFWFCSVLVLLWFWFCSVLVLFCSVLVLFWFCSGSALAPVTNRQFLCSADILFFTAPLIYQKKKVQIDDIITSVRCRFDEKLLKLQNVLPGAVKRTKAE